MAGRRFLLAASAVIALLGAAPALDATEVRRGATVVGERTSEQPALRGEPRPSAGFRLGATYRAWRNSAASVAFDASHSTGDGGDDEALAIDCGDERIAFASLEGARQAAGAAEVDIVRAAGETGLAIAAAWRVRRSAPPTACH